MPAIKAPVSTRRANLAKLFPDVPPAVVAALPTDFFTDKAVNKFYQLSCVEPLTWLHSGLSLRAAYLLVILRSWCPFADSSAKIPTKVAKLATLMNVSRPTMSRILKELTSLGFISMTRAGSAIFIFPYKLNLPSLLYCDSDFDDGFEGDSDLDDCEDSPATLNHSDLDDKPATQKLVTDCDDLFFASSLCMSEQNATKLKNLSDTSEHCEILRTVHPHTELCTNFSNCSPTHTLAAETQSQQDFKNSKTIKTLKDCIEDPEKTHTLSASAKPEEENSQEEEVSRTYSPLATDDQTLPAVKYDPRLGMNPPGTARRGRPNNRHQRTQQQVQINQPATQPTTQPPARTIQQASQQSQPQNQQASAYGIPAGPWMENGRLNQAFVAHTVRMWKESPSASFHKMADEVVAALVFSHFCKPNSQIQAKWEAFCATSYRHAENLAQAKMAGIQLTNEDKQKLAANSSAIAYAAESNKDEWVLPVQPAINAASTGSVGSLPARNQNLVAQASPVSPQPEVPAPTQRHLSQTSAPESQNTIEVVAAVVSEVVERLSATPAPTGKPTEQPTPAPSAPVVQFSPEIEELTEEQRLANMQRIKEMLRSRGAKSMSKNELRAAGPKSFPDNLQEARQWLADPILNMAAGMWARRNGYEIGFDAGGRVIEILEREAA
jgi:hypothetical protein